MLNPIIILLEIYSFGFSEIMQEFSLWEVEWGKNGKCMQDVNNCLLQNSWSIDMWSLGIFPK